MKKSINYSIIMLFLLRKNPITNYTIKIKNLRKTMAVNMAEFCNKFNKKYKLIACILSLYSFILNYKNYLHIRKH